MTKTIHQICREFLLANPSYSLKALEYKANMGSGVLSNFKAGGGLSDDNLVRLVACLLPKGLKITPNQAYASVDVPTATLYIGFKQSETCIETTQGAGTTFAYIQNIYKTAYDKFDFEASPRTPKKQARWWLTWEWEQTPLPAMQSLIGTYAKPHVVHISTPFGLVVGEVVNAQDFALTVGQEISLRRVSLTENLYEITEY